MLKGEKVMLRALEPTDVELLYHWENDASLWWLSNTVEPFSKFVLEKYIAEAHLGIHATKQLRLIIIKLSDEKPIGCIDLFDFCPVNLRAGIGVLIADKEERNHGYASESLELLVQYAFSMLHLHQLYCNIPVHSKTSLSIFEKQGFVHSGLKKEWLRNKDGWHDEYILQLINNQK